jgi:hypothetical protein
MNARELAAELAMLEKDQREQLLAELPPPQRDQLRRLIAELQPLLEAPSAFAGIMAELNDNTTRAQRLLGDATILAQLLRAETVAVKKQLVDVFAGGQANLIAAHVKTLVADYLEARLDELPPPPPQKKPGWQRFWKR